MVTQFFPCPDCGKPIPFDSYDDIFDTSVDTLNGEYIERAAYTCPHCMNEYDEPIVAAIHYTLKFKEIKTE